MHKAFWAVAALAFIGFLSFIGSVTAPRFAVILGAILLVLFAVGFEIYTRRSRERNLSLQLQRQEAAYTRLVREMARHRNDMRLLKEGLAETGRVAAAAADGQSLGVEERMLKNIAAQLTNLGNLKTADNEDIQEDYFPVSDRKDGYENQDEPVGMATPHLSARSGPVLSADPAPDDSAILEMLREAIAEDRIDVFLQPIVSLPQRKQRFFEMFSRVRHQGRSYLPAREYLHLAMKANLLPAIDNLLLLRALQLIRDIDPTGEGVQGYFCNISPLTLSDSKFMGDLVEFISENRQMASRLIFELSYDDLHDNTLMTDDVREVLAGLARLGCYFSLENIHPQDYSLSDFAGTHIRYAKMDAPSLLRFMRERGGFSRLRKIKADLDEAGADLIITHIESERDLVELLDLEVDYGQGFLFGEAEKSLV